MLAVQNLDYLAEIVEAVIEAGASVINIPDTVGYATPTEYGNIFRYLHEHVPSIDKVSLSCHCHDDLRHGNSQFTCSH